MSVFVQRHIESYSMENMAHSEEIAFQCTVCEETCLCNSVPKILLGLILKKSNSLALFVIRHLQVIHFSVNTW